MLARGCSNGGYDSRGARVYQLLPAELCGQDSELGQMLWGQHCTWCQPAALQTGAYSSTLCEIIYTLM